METNGDSTMAQRSLIVIPARGGSKGIPRKNVRLLAGRPLISYVIQSALQVGGADVVVTTDDDEIAAIARRYAVPVIRRSGVLAADETTLDPVVRHAWQEAEKLLGRDYQWVLTVQPTAPLISPESIREALRKALTDKLDAVVGVADARHLYWQEQLGHPVPLYRDRVNRQWLGPLWKETGGVVVTSARLLQRSIRIGGRTGLVVLPDREAIDIDSYDDWVVAEHRLLAPRVAIRIVGNLATGLGHVYRGLLIAQRLLTSDVHFFTDRHSHLATKMLNDRHFHVEEVNSDDAFIGIVRTRDYNLVVNDMLDTVSDYVRSLRGSDDRVVVNFEDLGSGASEATLVVNALYEYSTPPANALYGWRYVCLRDEFLWETPNGRVPLGPPTILVLFGGTDPSGMTERALEACAALGIQDLRVKVVVGLGNPRASRIHAIAKAMQSQGFSVEVLENVTVMSELMKRSTLAITSNGRTVYELGAMGVPMITVSQNSREMRHVFARMSGGAVDLGLASAVSQDTLSASISKLLHNRELLDSMRAKLLSFDLRSGVDRVLESVWRSYHEWRRHRDRA